MGNYLFRNMPELAHSSTETALIFASSNCSPHHLWEAIRKEGEGAAKLTVIALDEPVKVLLAAKGIPYKTLPDFSKPHDLYKETVKWVNEWSSREITGSSIQEKLTYKGISLWGFLHSYIYPKFERIFDSINKIQDIFDSECPRRVLTVNPVMPYSIFAQILLEKAIVTVATSHQIEISYLESRSSVAYWARRVLLFLGAVRLAQVINRFWTIAVQLTSKFIIATALMLKHDEHNSRGNIIFFSHQRNWNKVYDPITKTYTREDIFIHPLIRELVRRDVNYRLLAIDTNYSEVKAGANLVLNTLFDVSFPNMVKKMFQRAFRDKTVTWKSFYCYKNKEIIRKVKVASEVIKKEWEKEAHVEALRQSLDYKGISFWLMIESDLNVLVPYCVKEAIEYIECAKMMIEMEKPAVILLIYEAGPYGKALMIAASLVGVPTIGLQHGIIHPEHPDNMHDNVSTNFRRKPIAVPIPTKMAVYGNYAREVLTKTGHYPEESVVVTGQPRYDLLARADKVYNKKEICKTLGLDLDRRIVLLITCNYSYEVENLREVVATGLIAARQIDNVQLVIKPHPGEPVQVIREVISELRADNVKIVPGYLNELLYTCDVVVNQDSTVGLEAMILGKPVININFTGLPDVMPFVESRAALGVYKKENLPMAIKSILENKGERKKMKVAGESFIYEHAYKTDGKATERVVDLILEMAKTKV